MYIKNYPRRMNENDITLLFSNYGIVESVSINGSGFAFVTMETEEGADKAIGDLNGRFLEDENSRFVCKLSDKARGLRSGEDNNAPIIKKIELNEVFIRPLPRDISEVEVAALFTPFGVVGNIILKGFYVIIYSSSYNYYQ